MGLKDLLHKRLIVDLNLESEKNIGISIDAGITLGNPLNVEEVNKVVAALIIKNAKVAKLPPMMITAIIIKDVIRIHGNEEANKRKMDHDDEDE